MEEYKFDEYIMFVEDEEFILNTYKLYTQELDVNFLFCTSAEEAIGKLKSYKIFGIFSDFMMPNMTGVELCRRLREIGNLVPIVILSGVAEKEAAVESLRVGVTDLLDKPIDPTELCQRILSLKDARMIEIEDEILAKRELRTSFLEEAREVLEEFEASILELLKQPINNGDINLMFRKIHTIKGASGAVTGAENIAMLTHEFENVLAKIKDGILLPDNTLIDIMLAANDNLTMQLAILEDQSDEYHPVDDLVHAFKKYLSTGRDVTPKNKKKEETDQGSAKVSKSEQTDGVLVSNEKLDGFMHLAGELVAFKNMYQALIKQASFNEPEIKKHAGDLEKSLTKISDQIQTKIMDIRKVGLGKTFSRFPRMVRKIAQENNKRINLEVIGKDVEVDKKIAKALGASLVHLVRNSCDHGIESSEERINKNKPVEGTVKITARELQGYTYITLEDDGSGINKETIKKKAISMGLIDMQKANSLTDEEIFELIFHSGFSTASQVSEISGRGVGMDVVKTSIDHLGGSIQISSVLDQGTKTEIKIPVPKSVMVEQSIIVDSRGILMAIPLTSVDSIQRIGKSPVSHMKGSYSLQFRGKSIPLANYRNYLKIAKSVEKPQEKDLVVIVSHNLKKIAIQVDSILDQVQAVIRPFGEIINSLPGFQGVTVLSDDEIAYVISSEKMVRSAYNEELFLAENAA